MMKTITSLIAITALLITPALGQQQSPCTEAPYTDFDFWVGEWDVTDASGTLQGRNVITKEERGCLIIERWVSVQGGTGQSYNYYDPAIEKWRQVWISGGFTIDYEGGLDDNGKMVLEGEIHLRNGAAAAFRGIWTALEDGRVKQHFDQYSVEKEKWLPWFTGFYKKISLEEEK